MFQQLIIRVKTREFQMYSEYFSFFHSNSINKILTSKKIDQVILYRDLEFFDDETQYLKRTYHQSEAFNRIKKLISYYQKNMSPPSPILLTLEQYQYLDNRNRKILKLCIIKEKSQGQKQKKKSFVQSKQLKNSNTSGMNNDILPKLDETNLENIAESDRDESQQQSYDSEAHDVFENYKQKASEVYGSSQTNRNGDYKQILSIKNIRESVLVINFKIGNQPLSDFNNAEKQPQIIISQPPSIAVTGLKFNKSKEIENINVQNYQNIAIQGSNQQQYVGQSNNSPVQQVNHSTNYQLTGNYSNQSGSNIGGSNYPQQNTGVTIQYSSVKENNIQKSSNYNHQKIGSSAKKAYNQGGYQSAQMPGQYQGQGQSQSGQSVGINNGNSNFNIAGNHSNSYAVNSNNLNGINNGIAANNQGSVGLPTSPTSNKKSKISFMDYYHSAPIKNPTNILEKFMKKK